MAVYLEKGVGRDGWLSLVPLPWQPTQREWHFASLVPTCEIANTISLHILLRIPIIEATYACLSLETRKTKQD